MRRNSTQYVCLGALATAAMVCGFAEGRPKAPDPEPDALLNAHPYAGGKEALVIMRNRSLTKAQMPTELTVLVHDYTGLPRTALQKVGSETNILLSRTGIRVQWILCRAAWLSDMPEACLAELTAGRIVMRIVEHHIGIQGKRGDPLGSAEIDSQYATLYSAEIRSSAARHEIGFGSLMAYAATHEIGHLLLGPQHGAAGMMQAVWGKTEYRDMAQRWLGFEAGEREAMQGRVRELQAALGER